MKFSKARCPTPLPHTQQGVAMAGHCQQALRTSCRRTHQELWGHHVCIQKSFTSRRRAVHFPLFPLKKIRPPNQAISYHQSLDNSLLIIALVGLFWHQLGDRREVVIKTCHQAPVPSLPISHKPHKCVAPQPLQNYTNPSQRLLNSWNCSDPFFRN